MKELIEYQLRTKINISSLLFDILFFSFCFITGRFLLDLNLYSTYQWNSFISYKLIFKLFSTIFLALPLYLSYIWMLKWNHITYIQNKLKSNLGSLEIKNTSYFLVLVSISILIYISLIILLNLNIFLVDNNLDPNQSFQRLYLFKNSIDRYYYFPYFCLLLFSVVKRSGNYIFFIGSILNYIAIIRIIFSYEIDQIDVINPSLVFEFNHSSFFISVLSLSIFVFTILTSLFNYIISNTSFSDVSTKMISKNHIYHLFVLGKIFFSTLIFLFGLFP